MKPATRKLIEARAKKLLDELNIVKPAVDVDSVARSLRVPIFREALSSDVSGFLFTEGPRAAIVVNKDQPLQRQRFTIAHEIGHFLLEHKRDRVHVEKGYGLNFRSDRPGVGSASEEIQANAFAAALLMPTEMVQSDLHRFQHSIDDDREIQRLADRYEVSIQAFLIRLNDLDLTLTLATS